MHRIFGVEGKVGRPDEKKERTLKVLGSSIHGWGLFSSVDYVRGEIVAEYIGEYISNYVSDVREGMYKRRRLQDYQFRVSRGEGEEGGD